ncbi:MAG: replicative DNA helicase [Ignavibacteria bacterium]|jgi:replicative DNA helicase|nr:replicative DNA helicase [Ignavibacteria bacterium]HEX2962075.1 replicative DNA helicase [Ignavibacteriales bacterium]MCU7500006.1 replicative DNA helicase [Ignavibacteria bacterium]MCU7514197.1 replicative DNA helicase [Ignavibacteria bacterium]MCU7521883.1 replicative DNA helicase [Ignavibacteria bacterium]
MSKFKKEAPKEEVNLSMLQSASVKPPQAPEVEMAVLGAMMIEKEAVPKGIELLTPEAFYIKQHRLIFEAMQSLFEANEPIDTVTLYEELKKKGQVEDVGGAVYLSRLSQNISSAANIEYHAKIVLEKHILRGLISASMEIAQSAYEGAEDAFDLLDRAERQIFEITEAHMKKSYSQMNKAVIQAMEYIELIHSKKHQQFAVPTGFYQMDDMLGGFQKSDLIIIAARPSMGKTAFALSLARNAAVDHKVPVAIFSLEMATIQMVIRMICSEARLNAHLVRTGKLPNEEGPKLSRNIHKLSEAPIFIDDSPSQTILEIRAKCRRLKAEKNLGLIMIDYLQLMNASTKMESREREISHISRSLKALAKELNIPVIALAQLNRAVESRTDKRPMLSDLRESGSIEQDADVVMFIHRPEYYGMKQDADGNSLEGVAEIIIGKQRNGPTGDVRLKFFKDYARFENLELVRHIEEANQTTTITEEDYPI